MIQLSTVFQENLAQMPSIEGLERIDLVTAANKIVATIENKPGKQGSLAVYNYLQKEFSALNAKAAQHGLDVFAEHTIDARNRPGAHPNVDRLLEVAAGGETLNIQIVSAS
jgi:hypothetical protein